MIGNSPLLLLLLSCCLLRDELLFAQELSGPLSEQSFGSEAPYDLLLPSWCLEETAPCSTPQHDNPPLASPVDNYQQESDCSDDHQNSTFGNALAAALANIDNTYEPAELKSAAKRITINCYHGLHEESCTCCFPSYTPCKKQKSLALHFVEQCNDPYSGARELLASCIKLCYEHGQHNRNLLCTCLCCESVSFGLEAFEQHLAEHQQQDFSVCQGCSFNIPTDSSESYWSAIQRKHKECSSSIAPHRQPITCLLTGRYFSSGEEAISHTQQLLNMLMQAQR